MREITIVTLLWSSLFFCCLNHLDGLCFQDAYRWTGIVSQTGALCGSIVSFLLVVSGALY